MTENVRLQRLWDFTIKICDSEDATVGAGIVVSADGKIVTCAHVVKAALGMHPRVHPREAMGREIHVYFPQVNAAEKKARIATVVGCFHQHDDDVVLLQLKDSPALLGPEQIAQLGSAAGSEGNDFQSYGYASIGPYKSRYATGEIQGPVEKDLPDIRLHSNPVQLETENIRPGMSGGAVLDKKRNLVIGLVTERWNPQGKAEDNDIAWATDNCVLTFDPINLALRKESLPLGSAFQPKVDISAAIAAAAPKQKYSLNNAPPSIPEWVGRANLLKAITNDWIDSKKRIIGLIGFGGEGKSSLVRRWIDNLQNDTELPLPDGVFWWGFYDRPSVDEFFGAALNYLSGGNADLARLYPLSSAKAHFIAGMLHGGRYLFILDGLEVLQHQEGDQFGLLKSNDLREFLQFFVAPNHSSFCIVTSRVPLMDMMEYTTYQHRDVMGLTASDGRLLLQKLGVEGTDADLDKVVERWEGYALGLTLDASSNELHNGNERQIEKIPPPTEIEGRYERIYQILRYYDTQLDERERVFLKLYSVFRIPHDKDTIGHVFRQKLNKKPNLLGRLLGLKATAIDTKAINAPFISIDDAAFNAIFDHLVYRRILRHDPEVDKYRIHPLICAHYYSLLVKEDHNQIQEFHRIIKRHYKKTVNNSTLHPQSLEDLRPLIEVFHHACQSGDYDEAYTIYDWYINRSEECYLSFKLGAWETEFEIMKELFPDSDISKDPAVSSPRDKSIILNKIGLCLMNLGRLNEAEEGQFYMRAKDIALNITEKINNASIAYQNMARLYAYLGQLDKSTEAADHALSFAHAARDTNEEVNSLAYLAWSYHLRGDLIVAGETFRDAEALWQQRRVSRFLHSYHGNQHANHLNRISDAGYARMVNEENLGICNRNDWSHEISMCYRISGDLEANAGLVDNACQYYDQALKIVRDCSDHIGIIEVQLSRGRFAARHIKNADEAFSDLGEALNYAMRGGYRIYEADIRVALAWAQLAAGNKEKAEAEAIYAKKMSKEMGYYWGKKDADEVLDEIERHCDLGGRINN